MQLLLGRYRLDEAVGSGGFGTVYRAFDDLLQRPVAIKILRDTEKGSATLESSLREARAASALNRPSIVTVHDVGEHEGRPILVMEWIEGRPLRAHLSGQPGDPLLVAKLGAGVASALACVHAASIVHRDLKPENVLVREDGIPKVLDFGLARFQGGSSRQATPTRGLAGTVSYMAPESSSANGVGRPKRAGRCLGRAGENEAQGRSDAPRGSGQGARRPRTALAVGVLRSRKLRRDFR